MTTLVKNKNIKTLGLYNYEIKIRLLEELIIKNTTLTSINVSNNNLGTLGGVVIVGVLCMNKPLNSLKIEESQIGIIGGRDRRRS
ncbi:27655_t:CDS:2, partial [Dentiscutata erythropus]